MWSRRLTVREIHRIERLLAGAIDPPRRNDLEHRLALERLRLLGPNAVTVDPARLFHGSGEEPEDGNPRRFR